MFKIMAAANFKPSIILPLLFILFIISSLPTSFSQSSSPQNIQTFYPFSPPPLLPPPPPVDDPFSVLPPPTTPTQPLQPPSRSSTRSAVGRAIGITAASTLVLSALLFFILLQRSRRKRVRDSTAIAPNGVNNNNNNNSSNITPVLRPQSDNFVRLEGNVKGVIVDENGLDVLYWRKLEEGDNINNRSSFKKQEYKKLKDEQKDEEEKRVVSGKGKRFEFDPPVQQVPLLRGKSSTSQSPVWGDNKQDFEIQKQPTLSSGTGRQDSSVQLAKMSTPPLPPPPGPPPPPPPPRMTVEAVAKAKPPPKDPSPPPPPPPNAAAVPRPPKGKRSASAGEGESSKGSSSKVQLKPLHWDKVNPNVEHSMVWDKLDKGSFKFDGDLMEALFGSVATNRKSPQKDTREDKQGPPSQIFILDTRKSQNTAIVLKSIGVSRKEIIDTLVQGRGLNPDTIEKLARIGPTDEETSQILAFDGDPTRLADAESFLYHLLKAVPSAFIRFNAMLFRSSFDSEVSQIKESLKSLESGCNELRTRGLFLKLLEAILKAGNRLNAGTSRGNAQAFNLTALRKLSDVKSSDGKTTLLQFVVQEVVRAEGKRCVLNRNHSLGRRNSQSSDNSISKEEREKEYMMLGLPVIGGLSMEFSNVKKAASLDYDVLVKMSSALEVQVAEMRKLVAREDGGFARELNGFLDTAELEMRVVNEEQTRVMALVKKTTDYYQAGTWKDKGANPLHLFVMVRDFLGMVDKVCIEIARDVQSRKTVASYVASGSSSPESPRVFRFPKLPANFMSDSSKSSSSNSDDESSVR